MNGKIAIGAGTPGAGFGRIAIDRGGAARPGTLGAGRTVALLASLPAPRWSISSTIHHRDFEISHEQEINDVEGVVRLVNDDRAAAGRHRQKLAVRDADSATIGEVDDKWLKGLRSPDLFDHFDRHIEIISID